MIKLIAMYFTQLHTIPENDLWWGKGFTDWTNVKKTRPLFDSHNQPRTPLNNNYYDQSKIDTIQRQINLAKKYGIFGFCHYHYWFDGKQLLETPTNLMLDNPELDFPFCLSWANETWSKRWDGRDHHILIKQTHPPTKTSWQKHFDYLIRAWSDPRAIKVDGKPVFIIYRPRRIKKLNKMLDFWREQAIKAGLKGLYIIYQSQYDIQNKFLQGIDAVFQFQPFSALSSDSNNINAKVISKLFQLTRFLPAPIKNLLLNARENIKTGPTIHSYDEVWEKIINQHSRADFNTYKGAFVDWDNTARYGERARIFQGATPQRFEYWFDKLVTSVINDDNNEKFIFINAWNEWAEGAYLEPDTINKYQYLEAIERVLFSKEHNQPPGLQNK
jgi:hypothetical protein